MEAACRRTADGLRFCPPRIPYTVDVMVMTLTFHTKEPNQVGDVFNILLLPDLSPLVGLETEVLMRKWDTILGVGTLTSFTDTSLLMGKQKVSPIRGWDEAASQLEAWSVFCTVFLVNDGVHPATYDIFLLLEEKSGVSLKLRAQARQQPIFPAALLRLTQQEFNERFCQALERQQRALLTTIVR